MTVKHRTYYKETWTNYGNIILKNNQKQIHVVNTKDSLDQFCVKFCMSGVFDILTNGFIEIKNCTLHVGVFNSWIYYTFLIVGGRPVTYDCLIICGLTVVGIYTCNCLIEISNKFPDLHMNAKVILNKYVRIWHHLLSNEWPFTYTIYYSAVRKIHFFGSI